MDVILHGSYEPTIIMDVKTLRLGSPEGPEEMASIMRIGFLMATIKGVIRVAICLRSQ